MNQSSSSNPPPEPKYRPVLTASQIGYIVSLAKKEMPISIASISIVATLAPFLAKIENAGISAAYTPQPEKISPYSLEGLGGMTRASTDGERVAKEVRWSRAYDKYKLDAASCSLDEIQDAREWMYLEGMMSEEEAKSFEEGTNG